MTRRGWRSVVAAAVVVAAVWGVLTLLDFEPDPVRLPLALALVLAVVHLLGDALGVDEPLVRLWSLETEEPIRPAGQDARLSFLVRVITQHQVARHPDARLAESLAELTDRRLLQRHGVRREQDPERAAELLGPDLTALLSEAPGRRLGLAEIDRHLQRIEAL
ncbi:MAG: hypothetical protein ABWX84_02040 [Nocardioides sp.]